LKLPVSIHTALIAEKNKLENVLPPVRFSQLYNSVFGSPYKPYVDEKRCIFIHIPKVVGISISEAIYGDQIGHKRALYFKTYDPVKYNSYYSFTCVRNPLDRLLSAFSFYKKGGMWNVDAYWGRKNLSEFNTFRDFALFLGDGSRKAQSILTWLHFRTQHFFISDEGDNIIVDFIGKIENIEMDFNYVCSQLGLNANLGHKNRSSHSDYREVYDAEMESIVRDIYQKDFSHLAYE